jgi:hypothetical protein
MFYFKDQNDGFYVVKDLSIRVPEGAIQITQEEAEALCSKPAELTYAQKRADEYPPIGDQLDALWKGGTAAEEMLATVMAVKAKYPKPAEVTE